MLLFFISQDWPLGGVVLDFRRDILPTWLELRDGAQHPEGVEVAMRYRCCRAGRCVVCHRSRAEVPRKIRL